MMKKNNGKYETYVIIPRVKLSVVDDCGTKTPSRVDTGASNGDGGQVNQEHGEPNGQGCQDLQHSFVSNTVISYL